MRLQVHDGKRVLSKFRYFVDNIQIHHIERVPHIVEVDMFRREMPKSLSTNGQPFFSGVGA